MNIKLSKKHEYKLGKVKLRSVTEFIHSFFEPFDERGIAKKLSFIPKNKLEGKGIRYWLKKWKQSRDEGTFIHKEIEMYLNEELPEVCKLHPKTESAIKFLETLEKNHAIVPEQVIYSVELGLAGTVDCVVRTPDGIKIIDWKTNERLNFNSYKGRKGILPPTLSIEDCNYNHYCLQLNIYAYILSKYYNEKIYEMCIVHLEDGSYTVYKVPAMFDTVGEMIEYSNNISN